MAKELTSQERIELNLGLTTDEAIAKFKDYKRAFERDQKAMNEINKKSHRKLWQSSKSYYEQRSKALEQDNKLQQELRDRQGQYNKVLDELAKKNEALSAAKAGADDAKAEALRQEVEDLKELMDKYGDLAETAQKKLEEWQTGAKKDFEANFAIGFNKGDISDAGADMAEMFSSAMSKDMAGAAAHAGNMLAKPLSKMFRGAGVKLGSVGDKIASKGAGGGAFGMIAKSVGGLLKGLGPLIGVIGRLVPLINTFSGGVMAVVKLFLDAEAGAKEFQKGLLSTASTMHYLPRNMDDSGRASKELGQTLKGVRDAAFSLSNVEWGLNKDDYAATMNELTSAGMRLDQFKDEAEGAYKSVGTLGQGARADAKTGAEAVEDLTTRTVHLAAAYSRNMGVSMQEVSALMGEMKGQMGMPLEAIETAFGKIALEARDSGIAANTFFNIIRGMSADMSLFNNRMETAGKVLAKLTKVMDPRRAQQFLQSISQFFKGQSLQDRLKSVLIAGTGGTKSRLQEDINVKLSGLATDLAAKGLDGDKLREAVRGGVKGLGEYLAQNGEKLSGAEREAIIDAARQQEKVSRGDAVSLASALKDASPVAAYEQLQAMSRKMFNGKRIEQLSGAQLLAAEQALNLNDEQIDQFAKFRVGLDLAKAEIAKRVQEGMATDEDKALLKNLGIELKEGNEKAAAEALRSKDGVSVFKKMGFSAQKALTETEKQTDYAKETSGYQSSMMDKMQALMDWLFNTFYNAIMGIWDSITSIWGVSRDSFRVAEEMRKINSETVNKALGAAGGKDLDAMKHKLMEGKDSFGEKLYKTSQERDARIEKLTKAIAATSDETAKKKMEAERSILEEAKKKQAAAVDQAGGVNATVASQKGLQTWGGAVGNIARKAQQIFEEGNKGGKTKTIAEAQAEAKQGVSSTDAAAFDAALMNSKLWSLDPKTLAGIVPAIEEQMDARKQTEAIRAAQEAVDQRGANEAAKVQTAHQTTPGSIYVHDIHTEPLLADIAKALGASSDSMDSPELGEAELGNSLAEEQVEEQLATKATLADIYNVLKIKGIKINQSFLENNIKKVITEGSQEAMEAALFEFALLTNRDVAEDALATSLTRGGNVTGSGLMRGLFEASSSDIQRGAGGGYASRKADRDEAAAEAALRAAEPDPEPPAASAGMGGGGVLYVDLSPSFSEMFALRVKAAMDGTRVKVRKAGED